MKQLKILSAILVMLIVAVVILTLTENKKETGNFRSNLVEVPTADISEIEIVPSSSGESFRLVKTGEDDWQVVSNDQSYKAQKSGVDNLLSQISPLKAYQVVAKSKNSWGKYNVSDSLGTRLQLLKGSEILAEIVIGRMTFSQPRSPYQQQPDAYTYFRLGGDETVYSSEGMLSMAVAGGIDNFRSSMILECQKEDLTRLSYTYPSDSSFTLELTENVWKARGIETDSASTHTYLNSLRNFSNRSFASAPVPQNPTTSFLLQVEGNNMETIKIIAWPGEEDNFYLTSTQNEGSLFTLNQAQFEKLFKPLNYFLKGEN